MVRCPFFFLNICPRTHHCHHPLQDRTAILSYGCILFFFSKPEQPWISCWICLEVKYVWNMCIGFVPISIVVYVGLPLDVRKLYLRISVNKKHGNGPIKSLRSKFNCTRFLGRNAGLQTKNAVMSLTQSFIQWRAKNQYWEGHEWQN